MPLKYDLEFTGGVLEWQIFWMVHGPSVMRDLHADIAITHTTAMFTVFTLLYTLDAFSGANRNIEEAALRIWLDVYAVVISVPRAADAMFFQETRFMDTLDKSRHTLSSLIRLDADLSSARSQFLSRSQFFTEVRKALRAYVTPAVHAAIDAAVIRYPPGSARQKKAFSQAVSDGTVHPLAWYTGRKPYPMSYLTPGDKPAHTFTWIGILHDEIGTLFNREIDSRILRLNRMRVGWALAMVQNYLPALANHYAHLWLLVIAGASGCSGCSGEEVFYEIMESPGNLYRLLVNLQPRLRMRLSGVEMDAVVDAFGDVFAQALHIAFPHQTFLDLQGALTEILALRYFPPPLPDA
jgi:hypothetical protein